MILFQTFLFRMHLRKFIHDLFTYPLNKLSLQNFEPIFLVNLRIFDLKCHGQTSLKVATVMFCLAFMKFRKLKSLP